MAPSKKPHRVIAAERKIAITPYVTLIVNPTHISKRKTTETVVLANLRQALNNPLVMQQIRPLLAGQGQAVLTDEGLLAQLAPLIVAQRGFALRVHTPPPTLPTDPDALLLTHLIYGEATRVDGGIDKEMAAIAYSAINRAAYLKAHEKVRLNFFGANDRTLAGVVQRSDQYGSYNSDLWKSVDHPEDMTDDERDILIKCIAAGVGTASGKIPDPYVSEGGTYAMRTANSGSPGGSYFKFKNQIDKSHNAFFGLTQQ